MSSPVVRSKLNEQLPKGYEPSYRNSSPIIVKLTLPLLSFAANKAMGDNVHGLQHFFSQYRGATSQPVDRSFSPTSSQISQLLFVSSCPPYSALQVSRGALSLAHRLHFNFFFLAPALLHFEFYTCIISAKQTSFTEK